MRVLREHIAAYLFLLPAAALLFVFNVFPVVFSLFVSLHEWSIFPENYNGLENYEKALGDFAFVLFFWVALELADPAKPQPKNGELAELAARYDTGFVFQYRRDQHWLLVAAFFTSCGGFAASAATG